MEWNYEEDTSRIKSFEYMGRNYKLQAHDPNGFVKVTPEEGRRPEAFSGQYTSYLQAERAVKDYVNTLNLPEPEQKVTEDDSRS